MDKALEAVREQARFLANNYSLEFYAHFAKEYGISREIFFSHPLIYRLREDVLPFLNDGFGHGVEHSKKVSIDAGALTLIEARILAQEFQEIKRLCLLAQMSGLLHDISRWEEDHARKGAEAALIVLNNYPLSRQEREDLAFAVQNHEAFKEVLPADNNRQELLSGVLYDADKFRWGPDNFITTLWEICTFEQWSLEEIIERFPKGLTYITSIQDTFRTPTGQLYGPEFIQCGLELGKQVYRILKEKSRKGVEE